MSKLHASFVCGYQGVSEYKVNGQTYDVRQSESYYGREASLAWVGTVSRNWERDKFPPAEVVALFPGFVGARWNPETGQTEYDGLSPETVYDGFNRLSAKHDVPKFHHSGLF